jgi:inward rectifier potassium channel
MRAMMPRRRLVPLGVPCARMAERSPPPSPHSQRARMRLRTENGLPQIVHRGRRARRYDQLYAKLVTLSWPRLALLFFAGYLTGTTLFAVLYMLVPGSVTNLTPGSFVDAFAFSVQTISTIGYGTMAPATPYAHALVTVEALSGLLGVALTTGLVFAKFSMPRSNFVWSSRAVIGTWNGRRQLMLRVVNARSSEVVEARARVAALMVAVTPEGRTVRRLVDLALTRSEQPIFYAGWVLFHPVDETSPLHGMTHAEWVESDVILIATITGIDSTYSQTVHARKTWVAEDVRFDHVLADAMSFRDDGTIEIDHDQLDETQPEA